jgi:protein TonB
LAIRILRAAPAVDSAVPTSIPDATPPSTPDQASEKRRIATPEVAVADAASVKQSNTASGAAGLRDARSDTQPAAPPLPTADSRIVAEPSLAAAPEYAFGMRLDPGPRPLDDIEPDYPDPIRLREGTVVLRVLISETGHVDDVAVIRATPKGVFEQAAVEAFAKARFAPGMLAGTPVKSQITVEVNFMPINRGATITGRTY